MKIKNVIFISLCFLCGCATTNVKSFLDPDFSLRKINTILIWSNETVEKAFIKRLKDTHTEGFMASEIFLPTREYSGEQILKILKEKNIDTVLFVKFLDSYSSQTYVPESYSTTGHYEATPFVNKPLVYKSETTKYGGYYISKPRLVFDIELDDVTTKRKIYVSRTHTKGNAYVSFDGMINSLTKKTIKDLIEKNLINKRY